MQCYTIFFLNLNSIFSNNEIDILVVYAVIYDAEHFSGKQWIIIHEHEEFFTENFITETHEYIPTEECVVCIK